MSDHSKRVSRRLTLKALIGATLGTGAGIGLATRQLVNTPTSRTPNQPFYMALPQAGGIHIDDTESVKDKEHKIELHLGNSAAAQHITALSLGIQGATIHYDDPAKYPDETIDFSKSAYPTHIEIHVQGDKRTKLVIKPVSKAHSKPMEISTYSIREAENALADHFVFDLSEAKGKLHLLPDNGGKATLAGLTQEQYDRIMSPEHTSLKTAHRFYEPNIMDEYQRQHMDLGNITVLSDAPKRMYVENPGLGSIHPLPDRTEQAKSFADSKPNSKNDTGPSR